jgi:hypothetical protein
LSLTFSPPHPSPLPDGEREGVRGVQIFLIGFILTWNLKKGYYSPISVRWSKFNSYQFLFNKKEEQNGSFYCDERKTELSKFFP